LPGLDREERDLLIKIDTTVSNISAQFLQHCEDDAKVQGGLGKSLGAVHRRIDWLMISGVGGIIILVLAWLLRVNGKI